MMGGQANGNNNYSIEWAVVSIQGVTAQWLGLSKDLE